MIMLTSAYDIVLYRIVLHYIVLYCFVSYCILSTVSHVFRNVRGLPDDCFQGVTVSCCDDVFVVTMCVLKNNPITLNL